MIYDEICLLKRPTFYAPTPLLPSHFVSLYHRFHTLACTSGGEVRHTPYGHRVPIRLQDANVSDIARMSAGSTSRPDSPGCDTTPNARDFRDSGTTHPPSLTSLVFSLYVGPTSRADPTPRVPWSHLVCCLYTEGPKPSAERGGLHKHDVFNRTRPVYHIDSEYFYCSVTRVVSWAHLVCKSGQKEVWVGNYFPRPGGGRYPIEHV